jgi:predicted ATPase
MLKRLYADNYKSLFNFEFQPAAVNLLVGRNGSGKTSLFEVLGGLQDLLVWDKGASAAFSTETLSRTRKDSRQRFELEVQQPNEGTFRYVLELDHEREKQVTKIQQEKLEFEGLLLFESNESEVTLYEGALIPGALKPGLFFPYTSERSYIATIEPGNSPRIAWFRQFLANIWLLNLDVRSMSATSQRETTFLERNANNFASWYRHTLQEQPDAIAVANENLRKVLPGFRTLKAMASGRAKVLTASFNWPGAGGYDLDFTELSEGQRTLIVLYALLHASAKGASLVCFDEPDNFIELAELQPWLVRLSEISREAGNQILIISHNPEVIDYLAADHAWIFSRPEGGPTRLKPLKIDLEEGLRASDWLRGRYGEE